MKAVLPETPIRVDASCCAGVTPQSHTNALENGKVYQRLVTDTALSEEDYVDGIIRVYNNEICDTIDNYNCSAFYEPSYVIARAYQQGGF